jgi:hypothetical protein
MMTPAEVWRILKAEDAPNFRENPFPDVGQIRPEAHQEGPFAAAVALRGGRETLYIVVFPDYEPVPDLERAAHGIELAIGEATEG